MRRQTSGVREASCRTRTSGIERRPTSSQAKKPRSPRPKRASKSSRPNSPNWVDVEAPLPTITNRAEAGAFLDERIGQGVKPGLERITGLLDMMGNPETDYPVIHVAGTNGKTTVTRLIADILGAHGIRTGSFTSPHLHRIEERFSIDGTPLTAEAFTQAVADIAWFVEEYERRTNTGVTYFEVTAALAFSICSAAALDVAVVEVGLGGRWDATNVMDVGCVPSST